MKKYLLLTISILAVLALGASIALAYETPADNLTEGTIPQMSQQNLDAEVGNVSEDLVGFGLQSTGGPNFVDEDGDGVCDLMGTGQGNGPYGPRGYGNGTGVCGENFVDEDGDGVCDLMGTGQGNGPYGPRGYGNGTGQGFGPQGGCGAEFVDEDGDGICDLMGTGQGYGPRGRMNGGGLGLGQARGNGLRGQAQ